MANKIAVITSDFPTQGHPSYIFVEQLVNAMVDMGEGITVIAPQSITRHLLRGVPKMPRMSYGYTSDGNRYEIYRPYHISLGNCPKFISDCLNLIRNRAIKNILKSRNFDVLYAHFWENALPVYRYASQFGLPLFVACGEGDEALENLHYTLSPQKRKAIRKAVNGVISVSGENKRKCIAYNLIDQGKIDVFPNGVNTELFKPSDNTELKKSLGISENDFTVAFVGGFIHRKGSKRLADAISSLNDRHIKSIFIGEPFAGDCEIPDCEGIVFKGSLEHDKIPDYLNCADVFVLPTLKEGCCNAIVEALSTGLPVISSTGSFNDDIIDESNSIRVDPMDVNAIALAIKKMKEDKSFTNNLRKNIENKREQYSIKGRASKILDFINKHK